MNVPLRRASDSTLVHLAPIPPTDSRIRRELLNVVFTDQPPSLFAALVFAIAIALVLHAGLPGAAPWLWLAAIVSVIAGRYAMTRAFRRRPVPPERLGKWERAFIAGALAMGLGWGATGWCFYPALPDAFRPIVILIVGGILAASSRSISCVIPAFVLFALATVGPLALYGLLQRTATGTFMGLVLLLYAAFMIAVARRFRDTVANSFRLSFENADLAETLRRDIAARQAAEDALRASEERLRFMRYALDHAQDLVAIIDRTGRLLHVSEAFCRHGGRSAAQLVTVRAWECFASLNEVRFHALWDDVKRRARLSFETELVAADGSHRPVEINASYVAFDGREAICTIARDLTPRRALDQERARMQQQLQETQKLESLGVLAGGIAHDFNNLLTAILGNATLARELLPPRSESAEMLGQVERAANQAASLCRQMLAYAGKGRFVSEPVDLSVLVHDTARLLEMSIGRRAQLELRLQPNLPAVTADAAQLRQIVLNLVHNAAESMPHSDGRIVVSTSAIMIDAALINSARVQSDIGHGAGVCLEVTDDGAGMDAATLERIFEPFFTTKFTGRGLGLAAVLGIVRTHHGLLHVHSAVGRGTTFRLVLAASGETHSPETPAMAATRANHTGHVLVVDDEESVRLVARQSLERLGFTVETANDGEAALALVTHRRGCFRVVFLDLSMPRLDGLMTLRELRRSGEVAPVILMSGFSEQQAREKLGEVQTNGFLQKPFDYSTLRATVENALGLRSPAK